MTELSVQNIHIPLCKGVSMVMDETVIKIIYEDKVCDFIGDIFDAMSLPYELDFVFNTYENCT